MVKIKTFIISCCICLLIGAGVTIAVGSFAFFKSMEANSKLYTEYRINKLNAQAGIKDLYSTSRKFEESNKQIKITSDELGKSSIDISETSRRIKDISDKLDAECRQYSAKIDRSNSP